MNVVFYPFDPQHYLMNLRLNLSGALQSDRMGDQYCLILRLPYQQDYSVITGQIFLQMLQVNAQAMLSQCNQFIKVGENADVGLFIHGAVVTGFQVMGAQSKAASYAMFSCVIAKDPQSGQSTLCVYVNPNGLFMDNVCSVPAVVQLHVAPEVIVKHRREKPTGYYTVDFAGCSEVGEGNIWYMIPGSNLRYPVNSRMIEQKRIYIKTEQPPVFQSAGGVRVELI